VVIAPACPVGRLCHLEVVHASNLLDDAVACGVPDVHAEGKVRLGLHGQVRLDSSWPADIYTHAVASCVPFQETHLPLRTKDGGTLRTVLDVRTYVLGLSKDRELRAQWQRACELFTLGSDVAAFSKQVELALFYDAKP
jgi:hypothetical protein